ncbi:YceH family protein [Lysobacter niastensis]|uniref:YceH family protein n=1 Tax=Lysobacter niastensis TaxID=380629 RepID=A0ABS0B9L1_9GAMM|nr:YceH family protein [Lysobacter niastensis]MBF6025690.1 YceH family protein [Lysobacter niastensis]
MNDPEDTAPAAQLSAIEARIVGSLLEKQATTPDVYPLTLNAVVLACNQKTSREPVMQLETGDVGHALRQLEGRGWVKSQHGSRADRYEHRLDAQLGVTRAQATLLALLMLRGPQTVNELLSRSDRMATFNGAEDVKYALERLAQREPSLVREIPRQGGQREDRYAHLLSGEPVVPAYEASTRSTSSASALEERIEALEARVAELEARLSRLSDERNT